MTYKYEPDEVPKRKHHWNENYAGFVEAGGAPVGKCPSQMTEQAAEELLNSGVPYAPLGWPEKYPKRIYAVHGGVICRAVPTSPGRSYHGFPEHPAELHMLPRAIKSQLLELARQRKCEEEVKNWNAHLRGSAEPRRSSSR